MPETIPEATVFAALGDETRLALVTRLGTDGPSSLSRLSEGADMSRQAITKHLQVLQGAGLIHPSRQGRETIWDLDRQGLADARACLDRLSQQWDARLMRLRDFVEDKD